MEKKEKITTYPTAMAFYNPDGLVPAYQQAAKYGGRDGRVATLPDIVSARLATKPGDVPWETYFTTMSAEYVGLSRGGNKIIIVAHGVGPMATLDGVMAAYKNEYGDHPRNTHGGRISREEFLKLEGGAYGDVDVVDLGRLLKRYQYPFIERQTEWQAWREPLIEARLGPLAFKYIDRHGEFARKWHLEQADIVPENTYNLPNHDQYVARRRKEHLRASESAMRRCILQMGDARGCHYQHFLDDESSDTVLAHLLSIGQLMHLCTQENGECLVSEISCHCWSDGVRLAGVRPGNVDGIHGGLTDIDTLVKERFDHLLVPSNKRRSSEEFYHLVTCGGRNFTEIPKKGERMDTGEPEHPVTSLKKLDSQTRSFKTTIGGYHGFLKYGLKEVRSIAPRGANAYKIGEAKIQMVDGSPKFHMMPVTFYKVEVDTSQRLLRMPEINRDFDLMMSLVAEDE